MEFYKNHETNQEVAKLFTDFQERQVLLTDGADWMIRPMADTGATIPESTMPTEVEGFTRITDDLQPMPFYTRLNVRPPEDTEESLTSVHDYFTQLAVEISASQATPVRGWPYEQLQEEQEKDGGQLRYEEPLTFNGMDIGIWLAATAQINQIQLEDGPVMVVTVDFSGLCFLPRLAQEFNLPLEGLQIQDAAGLSKIFTATLAYVDGRTYPQVDLTVEPDTMEWLMDLGSDDDNEEGSDSSIIV